MSFKLLKLKLSCKAKNIEIFVLIKNTPILINVSIDRHPPTQPCQYLATPTHPFCWGNIEMVLINKFETIIDKQFC